MTHRLPLLLLLLSFIGPSLPALADGPSDNVPDKVRRVPPPGIQVPEPDRAALGQGVSALNKEIGRVRAEVKDPKLADRWPDVQIYANAVQYALDLDQFHKLAEIQAAKKLLDQGRERAAQLLDGKAPWLTATGPIARGYLSRIDNSVQPYLLDIPADFDFAARHRVDLWCHGRGETLSEINFISNPAKGANRLQPPQGIVLYLYGRYCNANKFAGEIDAFEALDDVKKTYSVDPNRVVIRGFSMGGAAAWHFAVHYAHKWAAAQPGAGFAETPEFLRVFQNEVINPTPWEQKLLHWYDCTDWAENVAMVPTVAYSGEKDKQKQAADIMAVAMKKAGLDLVHIIGPNMGHGMDPASSKEVNRLIDAAVEKGRDPQPKKIRFTTYTLRYPQMFWIRLDGLEEHWARAHVDAEMDGKAIRIKTENVSRVSLAFHNSPLPAGETFAVTIDGAELPSLPSPGPEKEHMSYFIKENGKWAVAKWWKDTTSLHKRRYLTGPIDDAFMDKFLFVEPTGRPLNETVGQWAAGEMAHATQQWQLHFRGIAPRKKDAEVTDDDIKASNLILWGDPSSNAVLKRIADKLPIQWTAEGVKVGDKIYPAGTHVPVFIYPNPLDPQHHYVVINSGFTYREYDYLNNARQIPRLPDWAVLDVTQPPTPQRPGKVVDANFFDERWRVK
jgi:hypothetical protein